MSVYGSYKYGQLAYSTGEVLDGAATVSASASISATPSATLNVSATSTSSASITCSGAKVNFASATVNASASISANARRIPQGSVLLEGTSTTSINTTGNGTRVRTSGGASSSSATVTPASTIVRVREGSATPSATATITASGVFMVNGAATLSATATVAAICNRVRFGSGTPTANASITVLGFATRGGIASTGNTFTDIVTVASVSGSNKYFVNGVQQPTLYLVEGNTYVFNYPSGHPLKFSTTSDGTHGSGTEYTTGVTHNSSTQVTIVVVPDTITLYYYCALHSAMGGTANTPSNQVISTVASDSQRIQQPNATSQPTTIVTATCNRVQSTTGALSATSGTATIGREKWETIINNTVTWTEIAA